MNILVSGSIAFDYLLDFPGRFQDYLLPDKLDRISVSFLVQNLKKQRGGCGANIAYNLALLGEHPFLLAAAGPDGLPYRDALETLGVRTEGVRIFENAFTSSFFGNTDREGHQICSFYSGAMQYAHEIPVEGLADRIDLAIIAPNGPEAMIHHASECRRLGIPYIFDPGQQTLSLEGPDLKRSTEGSKMLIVNEYEIELFRKKTGLEQEQILGLTETLIVTLGSRGAVIRTDGEVIEIPVAPPERVLDPTGVGDAFRAGLIKGMIYGLPWDVSGRMGSLAAAYVLETDGPQNHIYNLEDFILRYKSVFGDTDAIAKLVQS